MLTRQHGNQKVEILNIFHIHFSSFKDDITVDAVYMEAGETQEDHMKFTVDPTGRPLRYKILIKDLQVHTILYNSGEHVQEIRVEEIRFITG